MQKIFSLIASIIIPALIGIISTVIVQRNFVSKYEESSLIRELIPSLISSDPRQVDMALLILEGTISPERYTVIKKIIDKKIEHLTENVANSSSRFPQTTKLLQTASSDDANEMATFATLRKEWDTLVQKQLGEKIMPMSREEFLALLSDVEGKVKDNTQKQILEVTREQINKGHYFKAFVGADWVMQSIKDNRASRLVGICKSAPSKIDAARILRFASSNGNKGLHLFYMWPRIGRFGEPSRTSEEMNDVVNRDFLRDLKSDSPFELFKRDQ